MGRVEFEDFEQAKKYIQDKILTASKPYHGFFTKANELVLISEKSTRPLIYVYVKKVSRIDVRSFFKGMSISIYPCDKYIWSAEQAPRSVRNERT